MLRASENGCSSSSGLLVVWFSNDIKALLGKLLSHCVEEAISYVQLQHGYAEDMKAEDGISEINVLVFQAGENNFLC